MSKKTKEFEKKFAKRIGAKYALMVNSGSSANLLATFAAGNPLRKNRFKIGDEALIPSVCSNLFVASSTSWLKTKICRCRSKFFNNEKIDLAITNKTKVILLIHTGNSTNIENSLDSKKRKNYCNRGYL